MSFELARDRYLGNGNFREALRMWFLSFLASDPVDLDSVGPSGLEIRGIQFLPGDSVGDPG